MFTTFAIEAMGFEEPVLAGAFRACFTSVIVYETRGIILADDVTEQVA